MIWWLVGIAFVLVVLAALGTPLWIVGLIAVGLLLFALAGLFWLLSDPAPPLEDSQG